MRRGPGRPQIHSKPNPPGTKIARQLGYEQRRGGGVPVFHGGALTDLNDRRAGRPKWWAAWRA